MDLLHSHRHQGQWCILNLVQYWNSYRTSVEEEIEDLENRPMSRRELKERRNKSKSRVIFGVRFEEWAKAMKPDNIEDEIGYAIIASVLIRFIWNIIQDAISS